MNQNKKLLIGYKLLFGLLGFSAIITEIATLVERGRFNPVNFFSFFTIESNILAFAVLLLSAIAVAWGKSERLDTIRGAVTVYILIVGLGFSLLLAGLENVVFTAVEWDNIVLHYIMPAAVLADLLIDRPRRQPPFRRSLLWLLFPVAYIGYSLVRGGLTGWYPYPFLDPNHRGTGAVVITVLGIWLLALALTWIVSKLPGKRRSIKQIVSR